MADDSTQLWAQDEYHFYGQRSDEHVLMVKNQHGITLLPSILIAAASLLLLLAIVRFLDGKVLWTMIGLYCIGFAYFIGYFFYGYKNSVSILSDQRILNVGQKGFFHRQISEAELSRIQDVATEVAGIFPTMFGFGNVTLRTASENILTIKNIADPYDVQQSIVRALKNKQTENS